MFKIILKHPKVKLDAKVEEAPHLTLTSAKNVTITRILSGVRRLYDKSCRLVERSCDYLALAHRAFTSFSLMSSQRLSCSIWRSRSLMSPIVTHIGRAAYTLRPPPLSLTHTRTHWQKQQSPFHWSVLPNQCFGGLGMEVWGTGGWRIWGEKEMSFDEDL